MSHIITFRAQLASIMDVLAKATVTELCKHVAKADVDCSATQSLEMSSRFNEAAKKKLPLMMDSELAVRFIRSVIYLCVMVEPFSSRVIVVAASVFVNKSATS